MSIEHEASTDLLGTVSPFVQPDSLLPPVIETKDGLTSPIVTSDEDRRNLQAFDEAMLGLSVVAGVAYGAWWLIDHLYNSIPR